MSPIGRAYLYKTRRADPTAVPEECGDVTVHSQGPLQYYRGPWHSPLPPCQKSAAMLPCTAPCRRDRRVRRCYHAQPLAAVPEEWGRCYPAQPLAAVPEECGDVTVHSLLLPCQKTAAMLFTMHSLLPPCQNSAAMLPCTADHKYIVQRCYSELLTISSAAMLQCTADRKQCSDATVHC